MCTNPSLPHPPTSPVRTGPQPRHKDSSLVAQLKRAETEIEPYARTDAATKQQLLNPQPTSAAATAAVDAQGTDVIADSYQPSQVASDMTAIAEKYQAYIDGMGNVFGSSPGDEPYIELSSTTATATDEALATDYDGTLRFAPAWPSDWDASGTVYIQGGSKVDVQADDDTAPGDFDGGGASLSETALTNVGAGPGATVTSSGISFTFPDAAAGTDDNTVAEGQIIELAGAGTGPNLGFLVSASYGPATGTGTITYTDGTTQTFTLTSPDWFSTTPPSGGALAISSAYQNRQGNTTYNGSANIFSETVPLASGKTAASVTLPAGGGLAAGTPALHVFAIAEG